MEDFESGALKAVSFSVESVEEMQGWSEQKLPKVLPGYSGGRRRRAGRVKWKKEIGKEIAQEVVAGIKEMPSAQNDVKDTAQRTAGQRVKQHWDCSQIENEKRGGRG